MNTLRAFFRTIVSVEYALMASLLAIVAFASLQILGDEVTNNVFRLASLG